MARPREFDETTVLEAAMNCFWAQGFEQTSVRDLAERMGITGASLYNAFGHKRSLYRQAFVHYLTQTVRDRVTRLEKLPPARAIRTFFDEIIERSVDDEQRRGWTEGRLDHRDPHCRRGGTAAVECAARHPCPGAVAPAARGAGRCGQRGVGHTRDRRLTPATRHVPALISRLK